MKLGDTVASIVKKYLNIEPCDGCKKRQSQLNKLTERKEKNKPTFTIVKSVNK